jgi:hypothetical protein
MSDAATLCGAKGSFTSGYNSESLQQSLSSVVTSLTTMRNEMSRLGFDVKDSHRERTKADKATTPIRTDASLSLTANPALWRIFTATSVDRYFLEYVERRNKYGSVSHIAEWEPTSRFQHSDAVGIAVRRDYFGEGAERIVFELTEIGADGIPIGKSLVAKDSKYLRKKSSKRGEEDFHKVFLTTQMKAANFADKFNHKLDLFQVSDLIPRVEFLTSCVYVCTDGEHTKETFAYLSEERLDVDRYMKWNDNAGGVDGMGVEARNALRDEAHIDDMRAAAASFELEQSHQAVRAVGTIAPAKGGVGLGLGLIAEEDEEEEDEAESDDDDDDDDHVGDHHDHHDHRDGKAAPEAYEHATGAASESFAQTARHRQLIERVMDKDIPQAFTHFTYCHSKRKLMVCDLQGVLTTDATTGTPVFRLTDPCIHYESRRGRQMVYGRTDKGRKGMLDFFKTHQCNPVCELLGLPRSKPSGNSY